MNRRQYRAKHLLGQKQVAEVTATKPPTGETLTTFLDRSRIAPVSGIAELDITNIRKTCCVAPIPSRQDAVEEIDAGRDSIQDILRPADSHQVPGPVGGQEVGRHIERLAKLVAALANAHSPDCVTVEVEIAKLLRTRARRSA